MTLHEIIELAKQKFDGDFNDRLFLGQLVSLEDITTQSVALLGQPISRETIETCLKQAVADFKF